MADIEQPTGRIHGPRSQNPKRFGTMKAQYALKQLGFDPIVELVNKYKKGSKVAGNVSQEEINEIKGLLISTIEKTKEDYEKGVFNSFQPYTTSTNSTLKSFEEAMEFNNFHEGIHLGYILALKKSL